MKRPIAKQNWEKVTSDPWMLQIVQGYSLDLVAAPTQSFPPGQVHLPGRQEALMREEIISILEKGAIERVRGPHYPQWISKILLVPKRMD